MEPVLSSPSPVSPLVDLLPLTRDPVTVTEGTETVLDNRVTARYTHTLTVSGRVGELFTCTVANGKPSNASASHVVSGLQLFHEHYALYTVFTFYSNYTESDPPTNVTAEFISATTLRGSCSGWIWT